MVLWPPAVGIHRYPPAGTGVHALTQRITHPDKNQQCEGSGAGDNYSSWHGHTHRSEGKKEQGEHAARVGKGRKG